jgi:hypothetical protein
VFSVEQQDQGEGGHWPVWSGSTTGQRVGSGQHGQIVQQVKKYIVYTGELHDLGVGGQLDHALLQVKEYTIPGREWPAW